MVDRRRTRLLWNAVAYLTLGLAGLFALAPIAFTLLVSLMPDEAAPAAPRLTLANYHAVWQMADLPQLMLNSLAVTASTVGLCLLAGVPTAYACARLRFAGRAAAMLGLLGLRMVPTVLMLVPLFVLMRGFGLIDTRIGLTLVYSGLLLPIAVWLMIGSFQAVPREIEEAALVDGCSRPQALWRIVLPLARSGIGAAAAIVAITAWNEFLIALLLTSGSGARTWPVGLRLMVGEFELPWGMLAAAGILGVLPVLALFAVVRRTLLPERDEPVAAMR